jgi:hypothetical protein
MKTKIENAIQEEINDLQAKIDRFKNYKFDEKDIKYKSGYYDSYEGVDERSTYDTYNKAIERLFYLSDGGFIHGSPVLESFIEIEGVEFNVEVYDAEKLLREHWKIKREKDQEAKDKAEYKRLKKLFEGGN